MSQINTRLNTVSTATAAALLNRQPRTLHRWSSLENGPLVPLRINRRLAWRVDDIEALLRKPSENDTCNGAA